MCRHGAGQHDKPLVLVRVISWIAKLRRHNTRSTKSHELTRSFDTLSRGQNSLEECRAFPVEKTKKIHQLRVCGLLKSASFWARCAMSDTIPPEFTPPIWVLT